MSVRIRIYCLSIYLASYLPTYLSTYLSICLSVYLSIRPSTYLSVQLYTCMEGGREGGREGGEGRRDREREMSVITSRFAGVAFTRHRKAHARRQWQARHPLKPRPKQAKTRRSHCLSPTNSKGFRWKHSSVRAWRCVRLHALGATLIPGLLNPKAS